MPIEKGTHQTKVQLILNWILVLVCVTALVKFVESRKLDETTVPSTNGGEKCTQCGESSPLPPIVYPSPPPPPIVYPSPPPLPPLVYPSPPPLLPVIYSSPPPPSPKKPPSQYCPPPPSSGYIYMAGPPGNLYPIVEDFNGASPRRHQGFAAFLPLLIGLLTLLFYWY